MENTQQILSELARAKAVFQALTVQTILTERPSQSQTKAKSMTDIYAGLWSDGEAPKSYYEDAARVIKDAQQTVKRLVSVYILAAYDGGKVGRTRWLPDENRWEGFSKGQQPEKWLPYPEYPRAAIAKATEA